MLIKITMDGTINGTKVGLEDGTPIKWARGVRLSHAAGEIPSVEVTLETPVIEATGQVMAMDIGGRQISKVTFADGGELVLPIIGID